MLSFGYGIKLTCTQIRLYKVIYYSNLSIVVQWLMWSIWLHQNDQIKKLLLHLLFFWKVVYTSRQKNVFFCSRCFTSTSATSSVTSSTSSASSASASGSSSHPTSWRSSRPISARRKTLRGFANSAKKHISQSGNYYSFLNPE